MSRHRHLKDDSSKIRPQAETRRGAAAGSNAPSVVEQSRRAVRPSGARLAIPHAEAPAVGMAQQRALAELALDALADCELVTLADKAVSLVAKTLEVESAGLFESLPESRLVLLQAGVGFRPGDVGRATLSADAGTLAGHALRSAGATVIEDLRTETRLGEHALLLERGMVSVTATAIRGASRAYGVLMAQTVRPRTFSEEDTAFLSGVAKVLSMAIEQAWARDALRATDTRFSELFRLNPSLARVVRAAPLVLFALDRSGTFLVAEGKALPALGLRPKSVVGQSVFELYKHHTEILSHVRRALAGEDVSATAEIDGVWLDIQYTPLRDSSGDVRGAIGVAVDVTRRRQREEELHRSELEGEVERERLEAQLQQSRRLESLGQLAGGVAHDFNNLLAVILNYARFVLDQLEPEDPNRKDIEQIQQAANRGAALTRQLLIFGRREVYRPQLLDLTHVVRDVEQLLSRTLGEDVRLSTILSPELWATRADRGAMEQILVNLAVNARDAMPGGGVLTIRTANIDLAEDSARPHAVPPGRYVRLSVADTGTGMTSEIAARAFEPFFTTKPKGQGTGLGLAMVYGVVKQAGGAVDLSTAAGVGTTVTLYLPMAEGDIVGPDHEGGEVPKVPTAARRETVLVLEDEQGIRQVARRILSEHGYVVLDADSPSAAVRLSETHEGPLHLLLTDIVMPEMSGTEAAARLQELRPEMRVLYMSGYPTDVLSPRGFLEEGVALLRKPFTKEGLLQLVGEVLDQDPLRPPR